MALLCRTAATAAGKSAVRSAALGSKALLLLLKPTPLRSAPPLLVRRSIVSAAALGSVESLMPLHSAIASARLKSFIAVDSSCWSWLSQEFAVPR